ncbi:type I phosphomannose isomerase catalytic subunit [Thalassoglobus sp. JC818]|uniref:type I phosphomannose isomerase catalytic subunit n=1 Tax=Thalassoglobus sp. JC818 TaxID=3232136 RepID=UPI003459B111
MQPLRFHPIFKRAVWGGRRLGSEFGKPIGPGDDYAESWEISDLPEFESRIKGGEFDGESFHQMMVTHRQQVLGKHANRDRFPILVKFLDANHPLSVQVHPGHQQATAKHASGESKAELWIVLDAVAGSQVCAGLKDGVDRRQLEEAVANQTIPDCLHTFDVHPGDYLFLPPGTVHSLGEGVLIAEVQQSCDVTYRLHDWNRMGSDGKPRELHIPQALDSIDYSLGPVRPLVTTPRESGPFQEVLIDNEYFAVHRLSGPSTTEVPCDDRAHVLTLLSGTARILSEDVHSMIKADTILLPAERSTTHIELTTDAVLIDAFLGDRSA